MQQVPHSSSSFLKHAVPVGFEDSPGVDTSDSQSEATSIQSNTSVSDDPSSVNYPFCRLPTHPLILPPPVLNRKLKPALLRESWDAVAVQLFIMDVMGPLPATHNYHQGIHLCRMIFVSKYGFGRYMDNMALFWGIFHQTYLNRESDPHSASWSRWRHDRRMELEHVLCHSYDWGSDEGGSYLEEYIKFTPGESGKTPEEELNYLKKYGAKVTRFEIGWIGIENCNPEWADENIQWDPNLERVVSTNQGSPEVSRISSSRLSFEFSLSSLSLAAANPQRHLEVVTARGDGKKSVPQRESANQTHAVNVFAARKSKILSQDNGSRIPVGRKRAVSIHRSHSVWREAKNFLCPQTRKKPTVSGPINVTRGPSFPVTLLPIVPPAPELARRYQEEVALQSHLLMDPRSHTESSLIKTQILLSPECFQGSLYGQLEDLLVTAVNKFLKSQASSLAEESIAKERERIQGDVDRWMHSSNDKPWFRCLRGKFASIGKGKIDTVDSKTGTWFKNYEWGVMSGYRLTKANISTLEFYGHRATMPASVLDMWSKLIFEAFTGGRTRFDDSTVMRHMETVESVFDLIGDFLTLRQFKAKKIEVWSVLKQRWAVPPNFEETPHTPQNIQNRPRRASIHSESPYLLSRSPSLHQMLNLNRRHSLNHSVSIVWNEFGGSYATTPSLPPPDIEDIQDSPCYGKGRGKLKVANQTPREQEQLERDLGVVRIRKREGDRENALRALEGKQAPVKNVSGADAGDGIGMGTRTGARAKGIRFNENERMRV